MVPPKASVNAAGAYTTSGVPVDCSPLAIATLSKRNTAPSPVIHSGKTMMTSSNEISTPASEMSFSGTV